MSMVPSIYFNIQITGNDCRCCWAKENFDSNSRVIYKHDSFMTAGKNFFSGSAKVRDEEDQRAKEAFKELVNQVARTYKLRSDALPAPKSKCVKVSDILELKSWLQGVQAYQSVRRGSSDSGLAPDGSPFVNKRPPVFRDPFEVLGSGNRLTRLRVMPKKQREKVKASARVIWDDTKQAYVIKDNFFGSFREKSRTANRETRMRVDEEVRALAGSLGLNQSEAPILGEELQDSPLTYDYFKHICAWFEGVGAICESESSEASSSSPRESSLPESPFTK